MFADVIPPLQGGPLYRSSHNGASECHGSLCHDRAVQCLWGPTALSKRLGSLSLSRIIQKSSCEKSPLPTAQAQYCRFRMTWPNELGYPMQLSDRVGALIRSSLCAGFDSFKGVSLWPAFEGTSSSHQFDVVTLSIWHVFARARLGMWRHQNRSCLDMESIGVKVQVHFKWMWVKMEDLGDHRC